MSTQIVDTVTGRRFLSEREPAVSTAKMLIGIQGNPSYCWLNRDLGKVNHVHFRGRIVDYSPQTPRGLPNDRAYWLRTVSASIQRSVVLHDAPLAAFLPAETFNDFSRRHNRVGLTANAGRVGPSGDRAPMRGRRMGWPFRRSLLIAVLVGLVVDGLTDYFVTRLR